MPASVVLVHPAVGSLVYLCAVHPELQRVMARRCDATVEWPTSHSPFLSAPERVVDLLADRGSTTGA